MDESKKPYNFSEFFTSGQYETQVETLAIQQEKKELVIGVPKEIRDCEYRVALVPNSIRTLAGYGHKVVVERGAGDNSNYSDHDYAEAGAELTSSPQEVYKSNMIIKISPPTLDELDMMHPDQVLMSPLQLPILDDNYFKKLKEKRVTAFAMEYLQSEDGSMPIVRMMSEMAGMSSIMTAAELLTNTKGGRGTLLGGVSGVPPAKVVILGAGVVGEFATMTALGLGASVRIFDNDISKIMRLQARVGRQLHTSSMNPVYLAYQLTSADVVIGAVHSKTGRAPILVTEDMVNNMKEGAVIIDVSIDQGGCFETSRVTSHKNPTFTKNGVIHYCVPNISSKVSRTASVAISNIITPLILRTGDSGSIDNLLYQANGVRNGCYTYKGCVTNAYIGKRFGLKYTDLNLLLTSKM